jgi:hypothetical protein
LKTAAKAAEKGVSIFGRGPYREARDPLGASRTTTATRDCAGAIAFGVPVTGTEFLRVSGRILDGRPIRKPTLLRFLGEAGRVEGYAISGGSQPASTFEGYVRNPPRELTIVRDDPPCRVRVQLPAV